jgi:hypothetical protein
MKQSTKDFLWGILICFGLASLTELIVGYFNIIVYFIILWLYIILTEDNKK